MYSFWHKLENSSRNLAPGLVTLLLVLFTVAPRQLTASVDFMPPLVLMAIYYWGIFRPQLMPYWWVFILGLIQDGLMGIPPGISSLLFMLFRFLVRRQGRMFARQSFIALWLGFGLLTAIVFLLTWTVMTVFYGKPMTMDTAIVQWFVTVGIYPFLHQLFTWMYRLLPPT